MIFWAMQQDKCLVPITCSDGGFYSPPLQNWKRVYFLSARDRKKCCLQENAKEISILRSFSQIQRIDSFSENIRTNLAISAMTDFSKLSKRYFQYYNTSTIGLLI